MKPSETTTAKQLTLDDLSIVIPVYNAVEETLDCIASLLKSDAGQCQIWLMDDASEWSVQERIRAAIKGHENVHLVSHFRNRGYTGNIAMGVKQTTTDYVCILNSDTLLPAVWATPMVEKMRTNAHLAGIGPLSNAASYQSVPLIVDPVIGDFSENDGFGFDQEERAEISGLVALLGQNTCIDVPILNGFCTIFRRHALDVIGGFDVAGYPQGYGEENDLCIRLKAEGYRLCVFSGVFVHHQKSKSFGSARKKTLSALGTKTLASKFGPELIPNLSDQLKASVPLSMIRYSIGIALNAAKGRVEAPKNMTATSHKLTVGTDSLSCIVLGGGGTYTITPTSITSSEASNKDAILLSTTKDGIEINLPEGTDLTVFGAAPIATALTALSMLSLEQMIYVADWQPTEHLVGEENIAENGWPITWQIPEEISKLAFTRNFLAS